MSKRKKDIGHELVLPDGKGSVPFSSSITTVPAKLRNFIRKDDRELHEALLREFDVKALNFSRTAHEAWMLANLHVRRCIEEGKELPEITTGFFKSCCIILTDTGKIEKADLAETFRDWYLPLRPVDHRPIRNASQNQVRSSLAIQMLTMTKNYYVMHFRKRMFRYVQTKYNLTEKGAAYQFLRPIFPIPEKEEKKKKKVPPPPVVLSPEQLEVKEVYGERNPFLDSDIEKHLGFYIQRLHEIRVLLEEVSENEVEEEERMDVEASPSTSSTAEEDGKKGVKKNRRRKMRKKEKKKRWDGESWGKKGFRKFSLLPLAGSFVLSYMPLDRTSLVQMLKDLPKPIQKKIVRSMMGLLYNDEDLTKLLKERLEADSIFGEKMFYEDNDLRKALWSTLFKLEMVETYRRKVDFHISTNGYGVSIQMVKLREVADTPPAPEENQKKRKTPSGGGAKGKDDDDDEFDPMPEDTSQYARRIGVDPGSTYLYTAFAGQRDARKRSKHVQASAHEYRHLAWITSQAACEKKLLEKEPKYREVTQELSTHSLKVSGMEDLRENIRAYLAHEWFLFNFHQRHPYRKWRFTVSVNTAKGTEYLIKKMVGDTKEGNVKVLVGFGDWSEQSCLKGKPKAPVKKFRRALRRHEGVTMVKIDEYCTSKTCSGCHGENEETRYDGNACREVLRCKTCGIYWQRDRNASVNMRMLLECLVEGKERPGPFLRKEEDGTEPKEEKANGPKRVRKEGKATCSRQSSKQNAL